MAWLPGNPHSVSQEQANHMRVLYLCHRIPYPPNKGEKIRAFHQLRAMAEHHEVDLFTLADDASDLQYRSALSGICRQVVVSALNPRWARIRALPYLLTSTPLTLPCFHSAELAAAVRDAVSARSYDRIFVYCSAMAQYVEEVEQIPILTDLVDVDSDKWLQYARFARFPYSTVYRREGLALREYERRVCARSSAVLVTTEREAQLLREIAPGAAVQVVCNGVDTEYFAPPAQTAAPQLPTVSFVGDMSYFPNQQAVLNFARQVLPLIRQEIPAIRFCVVGRNPNREVRELEKLQGVMVTGFVPDVRTYLAQTHVVVAPFSVAAGIQNKILEALAFGLPVVGTPRSTQGLTPEVAGMVETGDTADELAGRIVGLLREPERARQSGLEARKRVSTAYNWGRSLEYVLQLLKNPSSTPGPRTCEAGSRSS